MSLFKVFGLHPVLGSAIETFAFKASYVDGEKLGVEGEGGVGGEGLDCVREDTVHDTCSVSFFHCVISKKSNT